MLTKETPPLPERPPPEAGWGDIVVWLGMLTSVAGLITWFAAYSGVDDWRQIQVGIVITGFGVTWVILGHILKTLSRRP